MFINIKGFGVIITFVTALLVGMIFSSEAQSSITLKSITVIFVLVNFTFALGVKPYKIVNFKKWESCIKLTDINRLKISNRIIILTLFITIILYHILRFTSNIEFLIFAILSQIMAWIAGIFVNSRETIYED